MRVLISTTGTGVGSNEEERKRRLEEMVNGFVEKVVKTFRLDKIVLLYTDETKEMVELIKSRIDVDVDEVKIADADDFNLCFETMLKVMKNYSTHELFVNYTYGTKTMSAAIASCAVFVNAYLICVAGERKGGIVRSGLEKVSIFDPYRFRDTITLEKVARFFNVHNFDASISEAQNLKAFDRKEDLIRFLTAYKMWDIFKHEEAFRMLRESWKSIDFVDKNDVKNNLDFLGRLIDKKKKGDIVEAYKMKLLDLMENAKRRIEAGFYDDAVARLYRATELISQILLKLDGYDDPIVLNVNDMSEKDWKIVEKFEKFAEKKDDKIELKLGLMNKLELLSEFGVDLAIKMRDDSKLKDLLRRRNESILAHGFNPILEDEARRFYEHLLSYVKEIYGRYYEKDFERCRFPKLEVLR